MRNIIIFSVLLLAIQTVTAFCPNGCDCIPDPTNPIFLILICHWNVDSGIVTFRNVSNVRSVQITCSSQTIPENLFAEFDNLQHLKIEACDLPSTSELFKPLNNLRSLQLKKVSQNGHSFTLKESSFSQLGKLEKLKITESGLERLPSNIYCQLKNIQVLNMSSNALISLKTEPSCQASQLIIVDFSRNKLKKIATYLHVLPAIRQLSLAHNLLSEWHHASFDGVSHLQQLDLQNNFLDSLEGLPETLIHISLANNRFSVLPKSVSTIPSLVSLNCSHNQLKEGSPSVLATSSLESLDLSFNLFTLLPPRLFPNSTKTIVHLNMEGNRIQNVKPKEFSNYTSLKTLNLGSNLLRKLPDEVFSGVQHLNLLQLANNSLDTIEPAVFADLSIDDLNLSKNRFTEAPIALGRLYKLKKLDLSENKISKLYHFIFNKIPHLHLVDLSFNELQSIGPYIFSDCAHLTNLDLSDNLISILFKDAFIKCPQLKKLDLSSNRIESLEDVLTQSSSIRRLNISSNRLSVLQWRNLPSRLEHLYADNNDISLLGAAYESKVRTASIRNNKLQQLTADQIPQTIEQLDLSYNHIQNVAPGSFGAKSSLRKLILAANKLDSIAMDSLEVLEAVHTVEVDLIHNPLQCRCELDWIRTQSAKRRISVLNMENTVCMHVFENRTIRLPDLTDGQLLCPYEQVCEPECVCCQYGNCDCKAVCPIGCSCFRDAHFQTNIVRCTDMNRKSMKAFSPSDVPMSATHVYLSGLSLPVLSSHSFIGRMKIQQIRINASKINTVQAKAFNTLPALKLIDLSDNNLSVLNGDEFHKTNGVTQLFLNGNKLKTVDEKLMQKLPHLQMITLHNNNMANISSSLSNEHILSLSLAGNPFRCDCSPKHNAPFWIQQNRAKVIDVDRVNCVENVTRAFRTNDTTILSAQEPNLHHDLFVMAINDFIRDANRTICVPISHGFFGQEPQNSILLILFLVACAFLLCALVLLVVSLARKTQSAINQRRYKASSSLNCSSTPGSSPLPVPLINFDAFVSYSKKDEKVISEICRRLEDADYSLCLLHRDGPIYNHRLHAISDELISQMDASQSLILILTKSFLENEWKTLQIKTSHQLFAKNRQKRLIAVFVDDGVDQNLLDDELGQMLRKNTCLRYTDPLFWTLLRSALPNRISPPSSDSSQIYSDMYGIVPSAIV